MYRLFEIDRAGKNFVRERTLPPPHALTKTPLLPAPATSYTGGPEAQCGYRDGQVARRFSCQSTEGDFLETSTEQLGAEKAGGRDWLSPHSLFVLSRNPQ